MILTISFVFSRIAQKDNPSCVCTKQYFLPSRSGKIRINLSISQEKGKENPFVSDGLPAFSWLTRLSGRLLPMDESPGRAADKMFPWKTGFYAVIDGRERIKFNRVHPVQDGKRRELVGEIL